MNVSCDQPVFARGLCRKHYDQARHAGTLEVIHWSKINRDKAFWEGVDQQGPDDCWLWTRSTDNRYGTVSRSGKLRKAHVVAYELTFGPVPSGNEIDHRCHVWLCCNPRHLRATTHKQNLENLQGAKCTNVTGVRGVSLYRGKYRAVVGHHGQRYYLGDFVSLEEAEAVVVAKRLELFTHNDVDRLAHVS